MFLQKIFQKNIYEDNWIAFVRKNKEQTIFLKLNYAFSDTSYPSNYSYLLQVYIFLDVQLEKQHDLLYEVEDKLSEILEQDKKTIFIATEKTQKKYTIYFYAKNDSNKIAEIINDVMFQFPGIQFGITIEKDRKWNTYFTHLAPCLFEYETYKNERAFYKHEKSLMGKELIFYFFISYKNQDVFGYIKEELEQLGFTLVSKGKGKRKRFPYALKLSKKLLFRLSDINDTVKSILILTEKYHCIYEGWLLDTKKGK